MTISFAKALGIHEQALYLRERRSQVLAGNIANADTPGFQARDIDFKQALQRAKAGGESGAVRLTRSHRAHLPGAPALATDGVLKYRNPYQPSLDGNTVELHTEQAAYADNAVRYQASLRFLGGRISGLKTALTGGR